MRCPVVHFEVAEPKPAGYYLKQAMDLRDTGPLLFNTMAQGFWVATSYDLVREVYQRADLFASESVTAWAPEPHFRWLPLSVDPPDHSTYRRLLNRWFSPATVRSRETEIREVCRRYIRELSEAGECDAVEKFTIRYPAEVFLRLMNLPVGDLDLLVGLVDDFFMGYSGAEENGAERAYRKTKDYCRGLLQERRLNPLDPDVDVMTFLDQTQIALNSEGSELRPLTDEEILDLAFMLIMGGLETTRSQMGWMLYHFATNPDDRQRLLDDPSLIDGAVEECLRYYAIIYGDGRKVTRDEEFHGQQLRKGDMILAMVSIANRDPKFPDADKFVMDRDNKLSMAFATGPHRCLGAHLAKSELVVALEEWLKAFPDYYISSDDPVIERGGMLSLQKLPLAWTTSNV